MVKSFSVIEEKLKQFTRKYYLNKIYKGLFFWFILVFLCFFLLLGLEYFLYLKVQLKTFFFFGFILFFLLSFIYLVCLPLAKLLGYLRRLSERQINDIIVKYFPEIKDKLLNIIELNEEYDSSIYSKDLIVSSIEQKIGEINKFSFRDSINLRENLYLFYYFIGILLFSFIVSLFSPKYFSDSTYRLINYKESFQKPSPYNFIVLNNKLSAGKGEDFELNVKVTGKTDVTYLNISIGGKSFLMKKDSVGYFSYKFNNLNNDIFFRFEYEKFASQFYKITILEKPFLKSFSVRLEKPAYTSLKSEELDNVTEFVVPEGTHVYFSFNSVQTDSIFINEGDSILNNNLAFKTEKNSFEFHKSYIANRKITVSLKNEFFYLEDYLKFSLSVIKDQFPSIFVKKASDSIDFTKFYFVGDIADDYGFSKLLFVIKSNNVIDTTIPLNISSNLSSQQFYFAYDFAELKNINQSFDYYFVVSDNDQINGSKSSNSEVFSFQFPDENEIVKNQNNQFNAIQDIISNSQNFTDKLRKDLMEVEKKMINSELTDWDRKEITNSIVSKKQNIDKEIEKLKDKSDEINNYLKSFTDQSKEILDKQKQIQNLLDNVMSDDLKKLLDEFNKMMQDRNKEGMKDLKDKLDISLDDLSKQLDKNLEMLKQMQMQQQLDLLSKDLSKISEEHNKNMEDFEKGFDKDKILEKEKALKDKISDAEKLYEEINKLNEETKQPLNLFDFKQEFNDINKEFSNTTDNLDKSNKSKAKDSMKKNSKNLKDLDFKMSQMMQSLFTERQSENLEDLLQILDNLVIFSFDQEKLIKTINVNNFNSLTFTKQNKLFSDFVIIKDSLYSLAEREPSLNSKINQELVDIQFHFSDIVKNYNDNSISTVLINQQKVLTSVNELSLLLSEIVNQLQKNMKSSMPGNKNCNKPGNNPNPNSMSNSLKSMQKSLQQQLEKAMQMMKDGSSGKALNEQMGKAISQQEAMHDLLQKMMNQGQVGSDAYETLKKADQLLNNVRDDILRNNISNSTIERQKQIMTRLLEADRSENERNMDEKRKSTTAKNQFFNEIPKQFEKEKTINNFEEKLLKNKLILNSYYQDKYQNYIHVLDSVNGEIYKNKFIGK